MPNKKKSLSDVLWALVSIKNLWDLWKMGMTITVAVFVLFWWGSEQAPITLIAPMMTAGASSALAIWFFYKATTESKQEDNMFVIMKFVYDSRLNGDNNDGGYDVSKVFGPYSQEEATQLESRLTKEEEDVGCYYCVLPLEQIAAPTVRP